jgi:O-6-methylguanine DNA methyltransferase
MRTKPNPAELFAGATDALLHGETPAIWLDEPREALALAARLRAEAAPGMPDPAFLDGLRADLRARAASSHAPASVIRYTVLDTPVGRLAVAYRDGRVVYCNAVDVSGPEQEARPAAPVAAFERAVTRALGVRPERDLTAPPAIERGVEEHITGRRRFTAVDLSWLTPFQRRVLEKTAEIPRGEVRPYGWVAREIGAPGATRAVGTALGHNPIPFIIPCHRVVRSDGSLGEYSGGGPAVKERVLAYEGVPAGQIGPNAARGGRYRGSRTTHIVCYPTCHAAQRIKEENAVPFMSLTDAARQGYRPCQLCRPA